MGILQINKPYYQRQGVKVNSLFNFKEPKRKRNIPRPPEGSKPYCPSNGTEGDIFMSHNCDICSKQSYCTILTRAITGDTVKQWVTTKEGDNVCISLKKKRRRYEN